MNKKYNYIATAAFAVIIAALCIFTISTAQLLKNEKIEYIERTYSQASNNLLSLIQKNESLLNICSYHITNTYSEDEDGLQKYIEASREEWQFIDFYFVNDNHDAITHDGTKTTIDFGYEIINSDNSDYIISICTLSNGSIGTIFTLPIQRGFYNGFEYTAIAMSFNSSTITSALDVSTLNSNAECYVTNLSGEILFYANTNRNIRTDIAGYFYRNENLSSSNYQKFNFDIINMKNDTIFCLMSGGNYCITYQPVGINDWMLVGVLPYSTLGSRSFSLSMVITIYIVFISTFIFLIISLFVFDKAIRKKDKEIKYREQLFEIVADNTDDIFLMFSPDSLKADYITPNIENKLGLDIQAVKNNVKEIFLSCYKDKSTLTDDNIFAIPNGNCYETYCELYHAQNGEKYWYKETIYHVNNDGEDKYILMLSDRTKERQNEHNLQQALYIAESANKAKSTFLNNMSHDIRTPLNAVIGFASLIKNNADNSEKLRDYSDKIISSGNNLLGMLNDILDMSKIDSGKTTINMDRFNIYDLTDELKTLIHHEITLKRHTFKTELTGIKHSAFYGDKPHISQIITNLLTNAVKYTDNGGEISLKIEETNITSNHSTLRFSVSDNGIGISESCMKKIFEPFERGITTNEIRGTGLGMTIAKNLVELMGGTITAQSKLGYGSTFTVELKLRRYNEHSTLVNTNEESRPITSRKTLSGLRFLAAEDNEFNAEVLTDLLNFDGASVDIATDGEEVVNMFASSAPNYYDFIFMDIQMPKKDGCTSAMEIRNLSHPNATTIPIAAMTANAFADDIQKSLASGMNEHITKPVDLDKIRDVVHRHICFDLEQNKSVHIMKNKPNIL